MNKIILTSALALAAVQSAHAVDFTVGAAVNSGFSLANGTDLATNSLVRFGVFNLSDSDITNNANSLTFLNSNFIQIGTATIGQGNPAGGSGASDPINAGLFNGSASNINTTASGLNLAGLKLYYWVFNAGSINTATQHGIFTSTLSSWTIPSGDGGGLDVSAVTTDIADLTVGQSGVTLAGTAKILVGSFGTGLNSTGGGKDFQLAVITAIPEPSTAAALGGLAILGFAAARRQRRSA